MSSADSAKIKMNAQLETAINRLAVLPDAEQQRLADWLLAELDDEALWQQKFAASHDMIRRMADDAIAEHRRGATLPFPGHND